MGLAPYGTSRWFNRVAVRASAGQLGAIAGLPCVARLAAVDRGVPLRDEPAAPSLEPRAAELTTARAATALDYGLTAQQLAQTAWSAAAVAELPAPVVPLSGSCLVSRAREVFSDAQCVLPCRDFYPAFLAQRVETASIKSAIAVRAPDESP
jgi:hypothetical protein